jgi:hypothetical protein
MQRAWQRLKNAAKTAAVSGGGPRPGKDPPYLPWPELLKNTAARGGTVTLRESG